MDFDPLDSKKRFLKDLLARVVGMRGEELRSKYAPPPRAPTVQVPEAPGSMSKITKLEDSDLELLADLVPSNVHTGDGMGGSRPTTPGERAYFEQNDPEAKDRALNRKLERDAREREEEG